MLGVYCNDDDKPKQRLKKLKIKINYLEEIGMKVEELEVIGLTAEQITKVQKLSGLSVSKEKEKHVKLKEEHDKLIESNKDLTSKVDSYTKSGLTKEQFEQLSKDKKDLESKLTELEKSHKLDMENFHRDLLLKTEIKNAGVKSERAIDLMLKDINEKEGSVKLVEGKLEGFNEVIEEIKKDDFYSVMFEKSDSDVDSQPKAPNFQSFTDKTSTNDNGKTMSPFDIARSKYE